MPHHSIVHNDELLPTVFINVAVARPKCKLPDHDRRPKHVAAVFNLSFNVNFSGL